ncbi:MAG: hypothetical protein ACJZ72_06425 [Opitutales bacterium]
MKDTPPTKNDLVVFVDGIGKAEFKLWHNSLTKTIAKDNAILFRTNDLSEKDSEFLFDVIPDKLISTADEVCLLKNQPDAYFFCDTADNISIPNGISSEIKKVCLLGGLGSPLYNRQLERFLELNFNFFFSDVFPEELKEKLDSKEISYFQKHFLFLPPKIDLQTVHRDSSEQKITFIYSDEKDASNISKTLFRKTLCRLEQTRSVNIAKVPIQDCLDSCLPGKGCEVLIADVESPLLLHYLAMVCAEREIGFHSLDTKANLSPLRTFLTDNFKHSDWLKHISPIDPKSLRQTFNELINPTKFLCEKVSQNPSNKIRYPNYSIRGYLIDENFADELDVRLKDILNFYQERNSAENISDHNHYLTNPIQYLLRSESCSSIMEASLEFFSRHMKLETSLRCLEELMETCLRVAANIKQDQRVYQAYYKLFLVSPSAFSSSFKKIFEAGRGQKNYLDFAAAVLQMVQIYFIEDEQKTFFLNDFLKLKTPQNLRVRALLAANHIDLFYKSLSNIEREYVGASVYYKLHQNQEFKKEELEFLKKLCLEEMSKDLDGLRTHCSFAIINILLNENIDVSENLSVPEKPRNDFRKFPYIWHEIALFSLIQQRIEEASNLLKCTLMSKSSIYSIIGEIAILILLKEFKRADELLNTLTEDLISDLWNPNISTYFILFYLSVILKYDGRSESLEKTLLIMKNNKIALDSKLRPLIEGIIENPDIKPSVRGIIDKLESSI